MSDDRLRRELQDAPLPGEDEARERGWRVVRAAFAEQPVAAPRSRRNARLALALAGAAVVLAAVLTPAGAKVVDAFRSVTGIGNNNAEPSLSSLPAPGRLLVSAADGVWVVNHDGSKRLLGDYGDATWSPHGLFVAAMGDGQLSAVEPDTGTPRWTLPAGPPESVMGAAAWSPSGFRVAYLSGSDVRLVDGSGRFDHVLARHAAPATPAWRPLSPGDRIAVAKGVESPEQLAYADKAGRVHIVVADTGKDLGESGPGPAPRWLFWGREGPVAVSAHRIEAFAPGGELLDAAVRIPSDLRVDAAALAPAGDRLAISLEARRGGAPRTRVELIDLYSKSVRTRAIVSDPGRFTSLAFSPNGRLLLAGWRDANQWLFIPLRGGKVKAVGHISQQFAPGASGPTAFPRVDSWCCAR
jgi:hypothetical protein